MIPDEYLMMAKLCLIAAVCAACAYGGYKVTDNAWLAKEAKQLKASMEVMVALQKTSDEVGKQLADANQARDADAAQHRTELAQWKTKGTVYVQCPISGNAAEAFQPIPETAVRFGGDFVAQWNGGMCLASGDVAACNRRIADDPASGADYVAPDDILQNESDNAESCGKDRARLRAWQDLAVKNGWAQ